MPDASKLIAFHAMGSQAVSIPMHSTLIVHNLSWPEYVEQKIQPHIEWGVRRIMLHLPFGKGLTVGYMTFDSYLRAREARLKLVYQGFGKAIRSLTKQGIEVIAYMGSLYHDETFAELRTKPYADDNWIDRFMHSLRPVINAGCSVAFDAAAQWPNDGPEHSAAKMLRALGTRVYIEGTAYPKATMGHLRTFDWVANHEHYWRNIAGKPDGQWAQATDMDGGGTLMISGHAAPLMPDGSKMPWDQIVKTYHEWVPPMVRKDLAEGFDVAVWLFHIDDRMTMAELLNGRDGLKSNKEQ